MAKTDAAVLLDHIKMLILSTDTDSEYSVYNKAQTWDSIASALATNLMLKIKSKKPIIPPTEGAT